MNSNIDSAPRFSDHADPELERGGKLNGLALAALLLGLASVAAMFSRLLWLVPGIGLAVSTLALRRLADGEPRPVSRGLALAGLVLSVVSLTCAPTHYYLRNWRIAQQSAPVGAEWIEFLLAGEPLKAYAAMDSPEDRPPLGRQLKEFYLGDKASVDRFNRFVNRSELVRTLMALGPKAYVQYYDTEDMVRRDGADIITNVYAVTYSDGEGRREGKSRQQKKTFFVRVVLQRRDDPVSTVGFWRIRQYRGGVRPGQL